MAGDGVTRGREQLGQSLHVAALGGPNGQAVAAGHDAGLLISRWRRARDVAHDPALERARRLWKPHGDVFAPHQRRTGTKVWRAIAVALSLRTMSGTGPEWIVKAARVARAFQAATHRTRGAKHSVYVVLLHDPRRSDPWGLYVGQTSRDPDLRFDQHKAGYKASSAARRFGVRLLPDLVAHLNPLRQWESLDLEAALAEAFLAAGVPWVEGGH